TSRSSVVRPMMPVTCTSLPAEAVRLRSSEVASIWKMTMMPIMPISTPTMISTRLKPACPRRAGAVCLRDSEYIGDHLVPAPCRVLRGLPAHGDRDAVEVGRGNRDLLHAGGGAEQAGG